MPTVGVDCQIVLDGQGYFLEPHTYAMHRPRLRSATVVTGGRTRYLDLGPGRRAWRMVILCLSRLVDYTGTTLTVSGPQLRARLAASYTLLAPLSFTDLDGATYSVHFDDYEEQVRDPRTQQAGPGYHVAIGLVEV
jgi:hypothetical protein